MSRYPEVAKNMKENVIKETGTEVFLFGVINSSNELLNLDMQLSGARVRCACALYNFYYHTVDKKKYV
jgi:hypothetical protein